MAKDRQCTVYPWLTSDCRRFLIYSPTIFFFLNQFINKIIYPDIPSQILVALLSWSFVCLPFILKLVISATRTEKTNTFYNYINPSTPKSD